MIDKLEQIDNLVATINVKGDDVFTLVKIRTLLKAVYDEATKAKQTGE